MSGYEGFLKPPTLPDIQTTFGQLAQGGVYLATTKAGSLAIIVDGERIEEVWLDFTEADLEAILVKREDGLITGGILAGQLHAHAHFEAELTEALALLGKKVMSRVALRLRRMKLEEVTLLPAGRLALLPLHAACYPRGAESVCFLDEFTVSYAANARTLAAAQRELKARYSPPRLVGVGNPLPSLRPLHAAQAELEEVADQFPEGARLTLYGEAATRTALLNTIGYGTHLHFSCHGLFDVKSPLDSCVVLSGEDRLTLRDFLYGAAQPKSARLTVLSACQTAISDFQNLPDECVGLPAGILQCGVPGVIGTLWPVDDLSTALLMVKFYELHLLSDQSAGWESMPPGKALQKAQQWLRDVTNGELFQYFNKHYELDMARRQRAARIAGETLTEGMGRFGLDEPHRQPFADKPFHWAPFVFVGV